MNHVKTSKITSIQGAGVWEADFGTMFKYDIALENGDSGEYMSKNYTTIEALPFKTGTEIDYEYHNTKPNDEKFPKIKRPSLAGEKRFNPNGQTKIFGDSKFNKDAIQIMIARQSSLDRATELLIHNLKGKPIKQDMIIKVAQNYVSFVMDGLETKPPATPEIKEVHKSEHLEEAQEQMQNRIETNEEDDLPF